MTSASTPANNIYVADTRNSRIVKLSSTGAWLGSTTGPATAFSFPLGVSAKGNKVYVGDTGRHRVVVLDQALAVTQTVVANGACTNINDNRDAQADSAGNIYVAGYKTNEIVKFAPDGTCITKWGGTGTATGKFRTPYGVDTGIDPVTGQELRLRRRRPEQPGAGLHAHRRVQVTAFGTYGEPTQVGTFTTMRRVAVAKDGTGNVWAADLWGDRIERWDRSATGFTYNRTIGAVMPEPTEDAIFHEPRGMAFTPEGDLWVTDTVHHQFQKFDADGDLVTTCGERAAEGTAARPVQLAARHRRRPGHRQPVDRRHQAAPAAGARPRTAPGITGGFVKNTPAGADTRSFNWPYDIAIRSSDRFAFVVDTQNHRIKAYDVANARVPGRQQGPAPDAPCSAPVAPGPQLQVAQRRRRRPGRARLRRRPRQQPDPGVHLHARPPASRS